MENSKITGSSLARMLEKQGYKCALSGVELTPETASLDHIQPLSRGGTHDMGNVWIVDIKINQMKSSLTRDEFLQMCEMVHTYNVKDSK